MTQYLKANSPDLIIFPSVPYSVREADPDFQAQIEGARATGFETALIDIDEMKFLGRHEEKTALYRGWMLSTEQYREASKLLGRRGVQLLVSPEQYELCHHLPNWYHILEQETPKSVWFPAGEPFQSDMLSSHFQERPIIVKDYVKSEKHHWDTACYIPDASNSPKVESVVRRFRELRDGSLTGGLVFREFLELVSIGDHDQSNMPLTLEYRLFFWNKTLLHCQPYWDQKRYHSLELPPIEKFEQLAQKVDSPFFTMDVACDKKGQWWIVELGDGQVSGLPPALPAADFYAKLSSDFA